MSKIAHTQGLVIVGAGPGGMAPLFAATNNGMLPKLLDLGITLIESGSFVGQGALAEYSLESDSSAEALLDVVTRSSNPLFAELQTHPATLRLLSFAKGPAPLRLVAEFLAVVGQTICGAISASDRGHILLNTGALSLRSSGRGTWITTCLRDNTVIEEIESLNVVLATGAHQPATRLETETVAGEPLVPKYAHKVIQTGTFFTRPGMNDAAGRLQRADNPKVAIVGGSTSAAAAAALMLQQMPSLRFQPGGVTILHRKPLRLFYESEEEALNDGYRDFSPSDVCRLTGRLYRLGGLRLGSRELLMGALGVGSRSADPRLRLLRLESHNYQEARFVLEAADLIIAAFGYRPRLLPVYDSDMREIGLLTPDQNRWSVVDQDSRLLDWRRQPLNGVFAIGLAVGPAASHKLGGEAGFKGQVNSLWLWQHTIGEEICMQVMQRAHRHAKVLRPLKRVARVEQRCSYEGCQDGRTVIAQELA